MRLFVRLALEVMLKYSLKLTLKLLPLSKVSIVLVEVQWNPCFTLNSKKKKNSWHFMNFAIMDFDQK